MFDPTPDQPPAKLEPWRQLLMDAAPIVRVRWRQGGAGNDGESRCALGAISEIAGHQQGCYIPDKMMKAIQALAKTVHPEPTPIGPFTEIAFWNDADGRTAEDVAQAMEAAAMEAVTG